VHLDDGCAVLSEAVFALVPQFFWESGRTVVLMVSRCALQNLKTRVAIARWSSPGGATFVLPLSKIFTSSPMSKARRIWRITRSQPPIRQLFAVV
jgi:hypothetical protein